jgi:DNA-binding transcriptional LysR family regulator
VRVAATTGDAVRLAAVLARFGQAHPGVRVALRQGAPDQVLDLVAKGSVDLAIAALPQTLTPDGRGVHVVALAAEPLVLLTRPGDPLAATGAVRLWDVRDRPFVLAEPGSALRETALAACARDGFGPVPLFEAGDPAAIRELVAAGLGVALVPASWARGGTAVALAPPVPRHALQLLARTGAPATPPARLLHEHLRAELS